MADNGKPQACAPGQRRTQPEAAPMADDRNAQACILDSALEQRRTQPESSTHG